MTLAAVPVAPVVVDLGAIATAFGLLLIAITIWSLRKVYMQTLGALAYELADLIRRKVPLVGGKIAGGIDGLNDRVEAAMAQAQAWANQGAALVWQQITVLTLYMVHTVEGLASDTYSALKSLRDGELPNAVRGATKPIARDVGGIRSYLSRVEHSLEHQLAARAHAIEAEIARDFGLAREGIDAVRGSLSGQLAHTRNVALGQLANLRHYVYHGLNVRLSRLEKLVLGGVVSGTALAVLTKYFPWWQCTNVRRFNRLLCRAPFGALDDLLGIALIVFGPLSIRELVRELQAVTDEVSAGVDYFVHE